MLWVDYREKDLIARLESLGAKLSTGNLPVGDVWIADDACVEMPDGEQTRLIIERKTVSDLASSFNDGRYEDQSFRLNDCAVANHNIVYLLEGRVRSTPRVKSSAIYGACVSLAYYKGFSVYRTCGVDETAEYLAVLDDKIRRDTAKGRAPYSPSEIAPAYEASMRKKKTYTVDCVGESMLCQVPGVSAVLAKALLEKYGSLRNIANACEDELLETTFGAKSRRISKTAAKNVIAAFK